MISRGIIDEIHNQIRGIAELDISVLVGKGQRFNFEPAEQFLAPLQSILKIIKGKDISILPEFALTSLHKNLSTIFDLLNRIKLFNPNEPGLNVQQARNDIVVELGNTIDMTISNSIFYLNFAFINSLDATQHFEESRILNEEIEQHNTNLEKLEKQYREALAKVTVSKYTNVFLNEATSNNSNAHKWLIATIVISVIFTLYAITVLISGIFSTKFSTASTNEIIFITTGKLLIASIFYTALIWSSKIYKAHRHNYVVNTHRQHALSTFDAFIESSNDKSTKDQVLLRTAEAIFAPLSSGYLSKEPATQGSPKILEIVRNAITRQSE